MESVEYKVMADVEDRHWWYCGMRAVTASLLDSTFAQRNDLSILDAGCGTGANLRFLRRYGTVYGVDIASEALRLAKGRTSLRLGQASVLALPFADASFDVVTSFDVLYHRAVADERVALREVARVLRPGGHFLIRLPAYEFLRSQHDQAVHTRRRYTASSAAELIQESGLVIERLSYVNSLLFPVRVLERWYSSAPSAASSVEMPHALINGVLRWPLTAEAAYLGWGGNFPFGLSVVCLARSAQAVSITIPQPRRIAALVDL